MSEILEPELQLDIPPDPGRQLFRSDDPVEVLNRAGHVADALKERLQYAGMVQTIQGRQFVRVEGWQLCASMFGCTARVVWSRPVEDGWEARAEVVTAAGRVISAAEAMCLREERNWRNSASFALRSMAQTRSVSKALRTAFSGVMVLTGHDSGVAEDTP